MSSSDRKISSPACLAGALHRRAVLAAGLVGVAAIVGGCLRPLYGNVAAGVPGGGNVKDVLRAIEVEPIPELIGHYLRNELVFDLNGSGQDVPKRFSLNVSVKEAVDVTVVDTTSGRADSATLIFTATWSLTSITDKTSVFSGESFARVTYDRSSQRFATLRASREARIRGAKVLSGMIRDRLAASLVTGS